MSIRSARIAAGVVILAGLIGCGGENTHRLSGTVTFKGQPVPEGKIYFFPDAAKGNSGAAGYADVKDGKYDTSSPGGRGIKGGAMTVAIEAWDPTGKPDSSNPEASVKTLFPRYETPADIPAAGGTKDFDVPASAANPPKK